MDFHNHNYCNVSHQNKQTPENTEIPVFSQDFDVNLLHLLQCCFFQKSADCGWRYSHTARFFQYVAYLTSRKILLSVTFNCLCVSRDFLSCFWTVLLLYGDNERFYTRFYTLISIFEISHYNLITGIVSFT